MTRERIPVFFIGCVQSSAVALRALLERREVAVCGVLTLRSSAFNADFVDISWIATEAGVPVHYAEEIAADGLATLLRESRSEIIFCIGWSRLLGREVLEIPPHGVVGFHPAALPANRGRHPLIWALALGLNQTASTLFVMDEGADSGPILSQVEVPITRQDDAQSLYDKVLALLPGQVNSVINRLITGDLGALQQDHTKATTWRKRGALDGLVDWRMSAEAIYNLTRALTRPYVGATFHYRADMVKLWRCEVICGDVPRNAEPGKVLAVDSRGPVVKTGLGDGAGAVRLLETENCPKLYEGEYL